MPPNNPLTIRREKRSAIVARRISQTAHVRAVCGHDVNVTKPRRILLVSIAQLGGKVFDRERGAQRTENDLFSVRRNRAFGVVTGRLREIPEIASILAGRVNIERCIVIPCVTALLAARAKFQLRFLFRACLRIGMRRSEDHAIRAGLKKSARRLTDAG